MFGKRSFVSIVKEKDIGKEQEEIVIFVQLVMVQVRLPDNLPFYFEHSFIIVRSSWKKVGKYCTFALNFYIKKIII